jgi:hypothetical protein
VTHSEVNLIILNRVEDRVNQIIGRTATEKMEKIQLIGSSSPCESNRASPTRGRRPLPFKRDLIGLSLSLSLSYVDLMPSEEGQLTETCKGTNSITLDGVNNYYSIINLLMRRTRMNRDKFRRKYFPGPKNHSMKVSVRHVGIAPCIFHLNAGCRCVGNFIRQKFNYQGANRLFQIGWRLVTVYKIMAVRQNPSRSKHGSSTFKQ